MILQCTRVKIIDWIAEGRSFQGICFLGWFFSGYRREGRLFQSQGIINHLIEFLSSFFESIYLFTHSINQLFCLIIHFIFHGCICCDWGRFFCPGKRFWRDWTAWKISMVYQGMNNISPYSERKSTYYMYSNSQHFSPLYKYMCRQK